MKKKNTGPAEEWSLRQMEDAIDAARMRGAGRFTLADVLALLPGTLCEWALAKRRSGVRLGYLCLRTLRGIGLVAFCPITVPVLLYALFSSRSR